MLKKALIISAVLVVALGALAVAGLVYAQTQTPPAPDSGQGEKFGDTVRGGYGPGGMMGGWGQGGYGPGGMMGGWGQGGYGPGGMMGGNYGSMPMHDYMVAAFAEALDLNVEDVQERVANGETMWDIALAEGLTEEETAQLMLEARTVALEQMVAEGVFTQEQADWMNDHMAQRQTNGFGPGICHGYNNAPAATEQP